MTSVEQPGLPADDRILRAIAREHRVTFPTVGTLPCAGVFAEVATAGVARIGEEITVIPDPRHRVETTPTVQA